MSVDHMALVFEAEGLNGSQKVLLLAYANRTDAHGYCWPGVERLAADTGMSEKTVQRTRKELEARNLLRHQRRTSRDGRPTTNLYRVNLDQLRTMRRAPKDFGDNVMALEFDDVDAPEPAKSGSDLLIGQSDPPGGVNLTPPPGQSVPPGGVNLTPDPSEEPSVDPSVRSARDSAAEADCASEHGRTDDAPSITEEHRATADELTEHADLSRVGARQSQVTQIRDALAAALAHGYTTDQVRAHLRAKLAEARTVRYVLNAFDPSRLDDIQPSAIRPALPPVCGQCDAQHGDGVAARVEFDDDGRARKCPRCHPHAKTALNGR